MKIPPIRGGLRSKLFATVKIGLQVSALAFSAATLLTPNQAQAQYLGATCGWQYSAQLTGPVTYPTHKNIALYNPDPADPNRTWDSFAEQLGQAGVDFVCPNLTGSTPNTNDPPSEMSGLLTALTNRGLAGQIKFAIFDDNAASWCAQWNQANGRGFGYALPMDMADPANWTYLYEKNYKVFYQTIPDANRFKINGRPVIFIWTSSPTFVANAQGNLSQALNYVRQKCQQDFGFNPYIVANQDFLMNDTTCANPGVVDATHDWFGPPNKPFTMSTYNSVKIGISVPSFGVNNDLPANHGATFDDGLANTVGSGALMTLVEGFTDYEEDAAGWRIRNLNSSGGTLTYDQTGIDYPNQRINLLRKWSRNPVPASMRFEAEGCDTFGGANGGNGKTNYFRNGNIAIETTADSGGGHDVGWMQSGEWFEWRDVPLNGTPSFQVRVATTSAGRTAHLVIDGSVKATQTLPTTGGGQTWTTHNFGSYGSFTGNHTVRIVFDNGGTNFNWWQTTGGTAVTPPTPPVNIAVGKARSASTSSGSYPVANVNDGNTSTRWQGTGGDTDWVQIDLGANTNVSGVKLWWEGAYASAYKIQTSTNGTSWTDRFSTTSGNGAVDNISFATVSARYVRMQGVTRATMYSYSLWEFEIFGSGGGGTPTNVALSRPVTTSSVADSSPGSNAVDGNVGTRWSSAYTNNEWIYVDLGSTKTLTGATLRWEAAYGSSYKIQTSDNASTWTDRYSTTTGDGGVDTISFSASARYVRMLGVQRATTYGYSLWEFEVSGY